MDWLREWNPSVDWMNQRVEWMQNGRVVFVQASSAPKRAAQFSFARCSQFQQCLLLEALLPHGR